MGDSVTAVLLGVILQIDLATVQRTVQELISTTTPVEATMYSGGGLGSLFFVRWFLKRRNAERGPTPAPTSVSTTDGGAGSIAEDKTAFTLPAFLPVSKGIRQVTHNEIHALELGLVVGAVSAWLFSLGRTEPVVTIVVAFVAGSLGFKRYSSKGVKTIRMEPWYALLAFAVGGGIGWGVFVGDPGLIDVVESLLTSGVVLPS